MQNILLAKVPILVDLPLKQIVYPDGHSTWVYDLEDNWPGTYWLNKVWQYRFDLDSYIQEQLQKVQCNAERVAYLQQILSTGAAMSWNISNTQKRKKFLKDLESLDREYKTLRQPNALLRACQYIKSHSSFPN